MLNAIIFGDVQLNSSEVGVSYTNSLEELNHNIHDYDFIVCDGNSSRLLHDIFYIRHDLKYLKPIVTVGSNSIYANLEFTQLNVEKFLNSLKLLLVRYEQVQSITLDSKYHLILKYIFIYHEEALAIPTAGVYQEQLYFYPLQKFYNIDFTEVNNIINELAELNLVKDKKYIDNCFCCSLCQSELLKFSECCPNCNSTNVVESKFIHCFKCGYVANESEFIVADGLRCHNCRSKLKLIGDDYDHPLESGKCINCQEIFIDGVSSSLCVSCNHLSYDTTKLARHIYYSYQVKEGVDAKFINYIKGDTLYLFDKLNYASKDYFLNILEWLVKLYSRHQDEHFNVFHLHLDLDHINLDLRDLSIAFKTILRTTDLYCKLDMSQVLLLFPKSSINDLDIIHEKLANGIKSITDGDYSSSQLKGYSVTQLMELDFKDMWFK